MGQYWTRKGDQEDLDEKTVCPWTEFVGNGDKSRTLPHYRVVCAVVVTLVIWALGKLIRGIRQRKEKKKIPEPEIPEQGE